MKRKQQPKKIIEKNKNKHRSKDVEHLIGQKKRRRETNDRRDEKKNQDFRKYRELCAHVRL